MPRSSQRALAPGAGAAGLAGCSVPAAGCDRGLPSPAGQAGSSEPPRPQGTGGTSRVDSHHSWRAFPLRDRLGLPVTTRADELEQGLRLGTMDVWGHLAWCSTGAAFWWGWGAAGFASPPSPLVVLVWDTFEIHCIRCPPPRALSSSPADTGLSRALCMAGVAVGGAQHSWPLTT